MNNLLRFFIIFSLSQTSIFAQINSESSDTGIATITDSYCVTLNTNEELKEVYKINISAFNFPSEIDAKKAFGKISNNYLSYKVDYEQQVVFLKVHSDRTVTLNSVFWWNEYLLNKCQ